MRKTTNGTFTTDTDWVKGTGWTIDTGTGRAIATTADGSTLYQSCLTAGKLYKIEISVPSLTGGTFRLNTQVNSISETGSAPTISSAGVYKQYIVATGARLYFCTNINTYSRN